MLKFPVLANCKLKTVLLLLQLSLEHFFKFLNFWSDHERAIGLITVQTEIILVIIFSGIKMSKRCDFGYDGIVICAAFIQFDFIFFRFSFLFGIVVKYNTAVLRPCIIPLTIECCWVVCFPEYFQ